MSRLSVPLNQRDAAKRVLGQQSPHPPANIPVANPTKSFWINSTPDANPLAAEGSDGTLTSDTDICIIGSGITGVGCAYHLSQAIADGKLGEDKPFTAVIVEARDFCSGATGRNGGHLTPAVYKHFHDLQETYGTEQAIRTLDIESHTTDTLLKIIDSQNLTDVVDLAALGRIDLSLTQQEQSGAKVDLREAKEAGLNVDSVEILSEQTMNDKYGTPYPGFRFPGHNLWPLKLVTELYKIAKSRTPNFALTLHTRTPVTSITPALSSSSTIPRRYIINTPRGPISCSYIVHATNAYTSHLLPHFTGPEGIIPVRGQVVALRAAVDRDELRSTGWVANESLEYWFPLPIKYDGGKEGNKKCPLVILGGGREVATSPFEVYEDDDSVINEDVSRVLKDFLPGLFEGKYEKGREPEMEWTGIMGMTKTSDPFVGPVLDVDGGTDRYKGQFISAGYSGHGMPRAFGCAEAVVDMVISEITGQQWSIPDWFPERFLTWNRIKHKECRGEVLEDGAATEST